MSFDPHYLTDPSNMPLGYESTNILDQAELRTPQSIFVGSYDPASNVTRNANGMVVGYGDLLAALLGRRSSGL